jgi:membrane fusion protein (multidrug efflux system)
MTKQFIFSISLVLVLLSGCSEPSSPAASAGLAQPQPQRVSVVTVQEQPIVLSNTLPGRVNAFRQSLVRPQVNGVITERLFEQGTVVKKGQQLYQIDDIQYKAALNSAKADVLSAKANVRRVKAKTNRYKNLLSSNSISQQDYDDVIAELAQAEAAVSVAEASVKMAEVNVEYTRVLAPISGRISRSYVTEGTLVTSNQAATLATITQLDPIYVDMQISGAEVLKMQQQYSFDNALPVKLIVDENSGDLYPDTGKLEFAEVMVDSSTGSLTLRAIFPNPNHVLLPGLFVRTEIIFAERTALVVPQRATIRQPDGGLTVYVVDKDNIAQLRPIMSSGVYKDQWIVTDGLAPGDTIIIAGYHKIRPGALVSPQPWQAANNPAQ